MKIIKNSKELAKLVDKNKDLILPDEDVRIEFEPTSNEIRNVECGDFYLENDNARFNFNGGDFNGGDFKGWNFKGGDFNGGDFNGRDFNGKKVSYYASFVCYKSMECESWKARRENHADPICLDGEIKIIKDDGVEEAIKLLEEKGMLKNGKILIK